MYKLSAWFLFPIFRVKRLVMLAHIYYIYMNIQKLVFHFYIIINVTSAFLSPGILFHFIHLSRINFVEMYNEMKPLSQSTL